MRSALNRSESTRTHRASPDRPARVGSAWLVEDARTRDTRGALGGIPLDEVVRRVRSLASELGEADWERSELEASLAALAADPEVGEETRDRLHTRLMEIYRNHRSAGAFALLYDLNQRVFFCTIYSRARRYGCLVDASDVLQEVFLNIYRYPDRFKSEKAASFRNWAYTIIRNTLLKSLRAHVRTSSAELGVEDLSERRDVRARTPLRHAIQEESQAETQRSYAICLHLYLAMFNQLSAKERRALELVEVEDRSYRDTADLLGIKLENLKMVIFRARKKIYRAMRKVLNHAS
ncbi:MAG: sigma-70 family RNA polymerase sigma factor [Planctomycetes bacterium]|nr:sigma-70 family RNA polymerase sigma factor [Planctomycetota bacterium]